MLPLRRPPNPRTVPIAHVRAPARRRRSPRRHETGGRRRRHAPRRPTRVLEPERVVKPGAAAHRVLDERCQPEESITGGGHPANDTDKRGLGPSEGYHRQPDQHEPDGAIELHAGKPRCQARHRSHTREPSPDHDHPQRGDRDSSDAARTLQPTNDPTVGPARKLTMSDRGGEHPLFRHRAIAVKVDACRHGRRASTSPTFTPVTPSVGSAHAESRILPAGSPRTTRCDPYARLPGGALRLPPAGATGVVEQGVDVRERARQRTAGPLCDGLRTAMAFCPTATDLTA
jgi:hypothetical protein